MSPRRRRIARYLLVVCAHPVIVRAPETFVAWTRLRRAVLRAVKADFGLPAREVHAIEGLAGAPDPTPADALAEADVLVKLAAAFAGDRERFPAFTLYAYDADLDACVKARGAAPYDPWRPTQTP